jgi:predicted AAA+ superfamily ATPase
MIPRSILPQVIQGLTFFPVVGIIEPRQVGKTTLAKILEQSLGKPALFLDLERDTDRQKLKEPEFFLSQYTDHFVIIDEIQNMPSLLPFLRWLVDQNRIPARFILTGSASPDIIRGNTESLAGCIAYFELTPFALPEIKGIKTQQEHWLRGGFPDALLAPSLTLSEMWLGNFIETFLHRDIQRIGYEITIPNMERLFKLLASSSSNLLNVDDLSRSLGVSSNTIKKYLDILEGSFLLRRLQPHHANLSKRLVKSPKLYLRDTGIMHRLLGIRDFNQLHGSHWLGASWETYVIEEIIRVGEKAFEYSFFRTQTGAEIDLVLRNSRGKIILVEIKYRANPTPSRGFYSAVADLNPSAQYMIVPLGKAWKHSPELTICSLGAFLETEISKLAAY